MVEEFFGLSGPPFKLSPDAKFFFGSKSHTRALAYLQYGLRQAEGFIVITGEIGAGKSMLIEHMIGQLNSTSVSAATLLTTNLAACDLLPHILSAYQIEAETDTRAGQLQAFEDFLVDSVNQGSRVLLIVDEAQNLPLATLEELRMLTNINYQGAPLFQVFLVGQPEFRDVLTEPNMEQLRQRVIASYHLGGLDIEDTRDYIDHRLAIVGRTTYPQFTEEAFEKIYHESGGVPRRINSLCTRLLLFCAMENRTLINSSVVESVSTDLRGELHGLDPVPAVIKAEAPNSEAPNREATPVVANTSSSSSALTSGESENITPAIDERPPVQMSSQMSSEASSQEADDVKPYYSDVTLDDVRQEIARIADASQNDDAAQGAAVTQSADASQIVDVQIIDDDQSDVSNGEPSADDLPPIISREEESDAHTHPEDANPMRDRPVDHDIAIGHAPSVFDKLQRLKGDLKSAHKSNRAIHTVLSDMEERQSGNVIKIENHMARLSTILKDQD